MRRSIMDGHQGFETEARARDRLMEMIWTTALGDLCLKVPETLAALIDLRVQAGQAVHVFQPLAPHRE